MIVPVTAGGSRYDIILEPGALDRVGQYLPLDRKVLVVTDSGVPARYADTVAAQCREPLLVCIPAGEQSKCLDRLRQLLSAMLRASFTRADCVVAVGGGVVGDLSGFAACCYMRGIDFYNIPTTLLSQLDSSIGGKTAIDFEGVKNAVGAFYQPKRVVIDPNTLDTLDDRQLHAGLAEAIKMSLTCDKALFETIRESRDLRRDLPDILHRALLIKKNVVEQDPYEGGLRRVLNFGHTLGHAIESAREGQLLHGECVALGMLPLCAPAVRNQLRPVLEKYCLPVTCPQTAAELRPYLIHDKKMQVGQITAVYVDEIGHFTLRRTDPEQLLNAWEEIMS